MATSTRMATAPQVERDGNGNGNGNGNGMSPRKEILGVVERNEQSYWTRIGVAFENRDGSWNLKFDYFPARPEMKVQLREPLPPRERE